MQNTSKAQQGQSFIDMVCQLTGSYEEVLEMAILNNRNITNDVKIADEIKGTKIRNQKIVDMFQMKQPATAIPIETGDPVAELDGIGYWIINKTFIVQ